MYAGISFHGAVHVYSRSQWTHAYPTCTCIDASQELCAITQQPAKYKDPLTGIHSEIRKAYFQFESAIPFVLTGLAYSSKDSFQAIR